jgi:hypothetical protein
MKWDIKMTEELWDRIEKYYAKNRKELWSMRNDKKDSFSDTERAWQDGYVLGMAKILNIIEGKDEVILESDED